MNDINSLSNIAQIDFKKQWITKGSKGLKTTSKPNAFGRWIMRKFKGQKKLSDYASTIFNLLKNNAQTLATRTNLLASLKGKLNEFQTDHPGRHKYSNVFSAAISQITKIEKSPLRSKLEKAFGARAVGAVWSNDKTEKTLIQELFDGVKFNKLNIDQVIDLETLCHENELPKPKALVAQRKAITEARNRRELAANLTRAFGSAIARKHKTVDGCLREFNKLKTLSDDQLSLFDRLGVLKDQASAKLIAGAEKRIVSEKRTRLRKEIKQAFGVKVLPKGKTAAAVPTLSRQLMRSPKPISEERIQALHTFFQEHEQLAHSAPVGFVGMVRDINAAIIDMKGNGREVQGRKVSLNGVYFFGDKLVIKPANEEAGAKYYRDPTKRGETGVSRLIRAGVPSGLGPRNELIGYLFDSEAIPMVLQVEFKNREPFASGSATKVCSVQRFVKARSFVDKDVGRTDIQFKGHTKTIQDIALMDIVLGNADRHLGNLLVEGNKPWAIDQGFILPETTYEARYVWVNWPQLKGKITPEIKRKIEDLNINKLTEMLVKHGASEAAILLTQYRVHLLKEAVKAGLSLADVGVLLLRLPNAQKEMVSQFKQMVDVAFRDQKAGARDELGRWKHHNEFIFEAFKGQVAQATKYVQSWKRHIDKTGTLNAKKLAEDCSSYPGYKEIVLRYYNSRRT